MQTITARGRKLDVGLGWFRRHSDQKSSETYLEHLGGGGGFFNMMRNLGGAVGIAVCGAILNARTNFHFDAIAYHLSPANGPMERLLAGLAQRYAAMPGVLDESNVAALKQLWRLAYREAATLAYADAFRAIMFARTSFSDMPRRSISKRFARSITLRSASSFSTCSSRSRSCAS